MTVQSGDEDEISQIPLLLEVPPRYYFPHRYRIALLGFFGFFNVYGKYFQLEIQQESYQSLFECCHYSNVRKI
jgi:hypothetical protein